MYTIEKEFNHNGYRCVVINAVEAGHRCGYVAVPEGHALFGVDYSENIFPRNLIENEPVGDRGIIPMLCAATSDDDMISLDVLIDVHGSITFSQGWQEDYPVSSQTPVWWFGFDCGHCDDNPIKCDTEYVTEHCIKLADQLERYKCNSND